MKILVYIMVLAFALSFATKTHAQIAEFEIQGSPRIGLLGDRHADDKSAVLAYKRMEDLGVTLVIEGGDLINRGTPLAYSSIRRVHDQIEITRELARPFVKDVAIKLPGQTEFQNRYGLLWIPGNADVDGFFALPLTRRKIRERVLSEMEDNGVLLSRAPNIPVMIKVNGRKIVLSHYPLWPLPRRAGMLEKMDHKVQDWIRGENDTYSSITRVNQLRSIPGVGRLFTGLSILDVPIAARWNERIAGAPKDLINLRNIVWPVNWFTPEDSTLSVMTDPKNPEIPADVDLVIWFHTHILGEMNVPHKFIKGVGMGPLTSSKKPKDQTENFAVLDTQNWSLHIYDLRRPEEKAQKPYHTVKIEKTDTCEEFARRVSLTRSKARANGKSNGNGSSPPPNGKALN